MERLVFENEEIARRYERAFREHQSRSRGTTGYRQIYMLALQVYHQLSGSGGGGGWPLSMFLTPEGRPLPEVPTSRRGLDHQMGFPSIEAHGRSVERLSEAGGRGAARSPTMCVVKCVRDWCSKSHGPLPRSSTRLFVRSFRVATPSLAASTSASNARNSPKSRPG